MNRLVPALALLAICVLATASCSKSEDAQSTQSTPTVSVSPDNPGQPLSSASPTLHAASPGCAAMDTIFTEALNGSETGQAYKMLAAKRSGETNADERHASWEAFASAFKNDYADRLAQAASDETSKQALDALSPNSPIRRPPRKLSNAVNSPRQTPPTRRPSPRPRTPTLR